MSCRLELIEEDGKVLEVRGADCKNGVRYAEAEFTDPRRNVTTTVLALGGMLPLLPVRTTEPIPKVKVRDVARRLSSVTVDAPVKEGQLVLADILGTGVDVIACRDLPAEEGA